MTTVTLVHKVPAMWEVESKTKGGRPLKASDKLGRISRLRKREREIINSFQSDVFFLLAKSVADYLCAGKVQVILGYDTKEVRNWDVIERNGRVEAPGGFTFWSTDSPEEFPILDDTDVLILRGNYPNFHNNLINLYSPKCTLFYPATSLFFPHFSSRLDSWVSGVIEEWVEIREMQSLTNSISRQSSFSRLEELDLENIFEKSGPIELRNAVRNFCLDAMKISEGIRNRKSPGNYSMVLYDDAANLNTMALKYPNSRMIKFNKAASPIFKLDVNSERDFDLIFTGTTIQRTKNTELFYQIVDRLLSLRPHTRVAIVGVESGSEKLRKRWGEGRVEVMGRISGEELCSVFNRCKIHLVTSGRDCFPRTIPESAACGCFNLALDILSDGLTVIGDNPVLGAVIDSSRDLMILEESHSITIELLGDSIISQISDHIDEKKNPLMISTLAKSLFPTEEMIQLDLVWEDIDLKEGFANE